jgi:peroxiredoxin
MEAGMADRLPGEVLEVFGAERKRLAAAGLPEGIVRPGTPMPDGDLLDVHGAPASLAAVRAGRPAVVVLYRGAWCPYCNIALRAYEQQLAPPLAERGVTLIAVSPQNPDGSLSMREANALTYGVVSDPGQAIARALGVLAQPGKEALEAQSAIGLDVTARNADGTVLLPLPTTVLVDAAGTIRWIDVHSDFGERSEPLAILDAVDTLLN